MKDKILNHKHYEYVRDILKIFNNSSVIIYSDINNNNEIIEKINKTMDTFKELFELKFFSLSRINYVFTTTSQIWAFLKKLLNYCKIKFEVVRHKQNIELRLFPNSLLSLDNIKMANIGQNITAPNISKMILEKDEENAKIVGCSMIPFSEILEKYKTEPYSKTYIVMTRDFMLSNTDFEYFYYIENISDVDIDVELQIGENAYNREKISKNNKFEINFPNNIFFKYHDVKLIFHTNYTNGFKININGFKFSKKMKNYDNYGIVYDHRIFKQYINIEHLGRSVYLKSMSGLVGHSYLNQPIKDLIKDPEKEKLTVEFDEYIKNNLVEETSFTYNEKHYNLISVDRGNTLIAEYGKFDLAGLDTFSKLSKMTQFIENGYSLLSKDVKYDDFLVLSKNNNITKASFIETKEDIIYVCHKILRYADMIKYFKLNPITEITLDKNDVFEIDLVYGGGNTLKLGKYYGDDVFNVINFNMFYVLINKHYHLSYIRITSDIKYLNLFETVKIDFGYVFANNDFRRELSRTDIMEL